jgi:recombinational DNA repair protein (RecF pathway)
MSTMATALRCAGCGSTDEDELFALARDLHVCRRCARRALVAIDMREDRDTRTADGHP